MTRTFPAAGGTALTATFAALAGAKRGIAKVSLFMNGFPMTDVPGASFGPLGQGEQNYTLTVPLSMPDSVYDVFIRASDDLGNSADTPTQVLTKNAPCATSDACLAQQTCSDGRCAWPASAGELGDECTYNQFCKSLLCRGTADLQICTQTCEAEDPQACPPGLSCIQGVCFVEGGGCCSTSRGGWMPAGLLAILVLMGIMRRRPT